MSKKAVKKTAKKVATKAPKEDIFSLILHDHKPLWSLIETLKDEEASNEERVKAFDEFAQRLVNHAKSEELSLYKAMKAEKDFRMQGIEGDVEHGIADQLLEEIKRTEDEDVWTAKVKVLAELVEHHLEEEEEEQFPEVRAHFSQEERIKLGEVYRRLTAKFAEAGNEDAPSEEGSQFEEVSRH